MTPRILILLPLTLALTVSCHRETAPISALQEELDEAEAALSKTRRRISDIRAALSQVTEAREKASSAVDEMHQAMVKAQDDAKALKEAFATYRKQYHDAILKRAPGMILGELQIGEKHYSKAQVTALDGWELAFRHSEGSLRVDLSQLTPAVQELLGYDPTLGPKPSAKPLVINVPEGPASSPSAEPPPLPPPTGPVKTSRPTEGAISVSGSRIGKIIKLKDGSTVEVVAPLDGRGGNKIKTKTGNK